MTIHEAAVGATVEWYTPPELFTALGLRFDLDPASPGAAVLPWIPQRRHRTKDEDGLRCPWSGRVWLNPPYGPAAVRFIGRMIGHADGVMLLPARTETRAFQRALVEADAVCFMRDRLHFIRADGLQARSSFASVLFAFGSECARAVGDADLGVTVRP